MVGYSFPAQPDNGTQLQVYRLPDGARLWTRQAYLADILAFSPDERVVAIHGGGRFQFFDSRTGAKLASPGLGGGEGIRRLAVGPQGQSALLAGSGGVFQLNGDPTDGDPPDSRYPTPDGQGAPVM